MPFSMFEWWKDLFRPIRREDQDFGKMRFLRQTTTWECRARFEPVGREVEVLVFASEPGPTKPQRQLWRELISRYPDLESRLRSELDALSKWRQASAFVFKLAAVSLPEESNTPCELELTFGDESGPPQFDVRVESWEIREIVGPL